MKPRLLDLFCGAGMAADGYAAAGFEVVGVDIKPQPDYPYEFFQADALQVLSGSHLGPRGKCWCFDFDVIHASPPCQLFTRAKHLRDAQGGKSKAVDLLTPTLALLREFDMPPIPWVVENVENAKSLMQPLVDFHPEGNEYLVCVCGSAFGLEVQRHRLFLSNVPVVGTAHYHDRFPIDPVSGKPRPWGVYHVPGDSIPAGGRTARDAEHARELFGMARSLPWDSLKEGFPPAYTVWIGAQLLDEIRHADTVLMARAITGGSTNPDDSRGAA